MRVNLAGHSGTCQIPGKTWCAEFSALEVSYETQSAASCVACRRMGINAHKEVLRLSRTWFMCMILMSVCRSL